MEAEREDGSHQPQHHAKPWRRVMDKLWSDMGHFAGKAFRLAMI